MLDKSKISKIKPALVVLLLLGIYAHGCGRLWGGLARNGSSGSTALQDIFGIFVGGIGVTSATTGTCPGGNQAASTWCTGGTFALNVNNGGFRNPSATAVDPTGYLFTLERAGARISKYTIDGSYVGSIGQDSASTGTCINGGIATGWCTGGQFINGTVDGAISNSSNGLAIDTTNRKLYVADTGNHRVLKVDIATGTVEGAIGRTTATTGSCPAAGAAPGWCTGGTFASGASDGMFNQPNDVAVDPQGDLLYVSDTSNFRIVKITLSTGAFVGAIGNTTATGGTCPAAGPAPSWCTAGTFSSVVTDGGYGGPTYLAIDVSGNALYVSDGNRVVKSTLSTGAFVGAVGNLTGSTGTCPAAGAASGWCTGGTFNFGTSDGMFNNPHGIVVHPAAGYLYVSDRGNFRIQKISMSTGAFVGAIGGLSASTGTCPSSGTSSSWCTGGTFASGATDGKFNFAYGISIDTVNYNLFVADQSNHRIIKIR
jgi:DNA-binding beta-propeller fold protein YncE